MGDISYNETTDRYEQVVDGHLVYAKVHRKDGLLYIDFVYADPALRGSGAASAFMSSLMEIVRREGLKAMPICSYAASWLRRHSEYSDLLGEF